jgi:hypothetical protein
LARYPQPETIRVIPRRTAVPLLLTVLCGSAIPALADVQPTNVAVAAVPVGRVAGRAIASSTRLAVSWTRPDRAQHVEVVAREALQGTEVRVSVAADASTATVSGLKAATTYVVTVVACDDDACTRGSSSTAVERATDTEYWQLEGVGHTVDRLATVVSDGNARLSATRFGLDAGDMAGHVQQGDIDGPQPRAASGVI